jgi:hypothetical protein
VISISSLNAASAALTLQKPQHQAPPASPAPVAASGFIRSTSGAKVPSSIAAMALRGAEAETSPDDRTIGAQEVPDGDVDDR